MSMHHLTNAFRKCGIVPYNPKAIDKGLIRGLHEDVDLSMSNNDYDLQQLGNSLHTDEADGQISSNEETGSAIIDALDSASDLQPPKHEDIDFSMPNYDDDLPQLGDPLHAHAVDWQMSSNEETGSAIML